MRHKLISGPTGSMSERAPRRGVATSLEKTQEGLEEHRASRPWRLVVSIATLALGLTVMAEVSHAQIMVGPQTGRNPGNTADLLCNQGCAGPRRQFKSEAGFNGPAGPIFLTARYASTLDVDVSGIGNTESESANSSYFVSFTVQANSPDQKWSLKISSYRQGFYTIKDDAGGYADVMITTPITAAITIGGTPTTLTDLQFPGGSITNQGASGTSPNTPIESLSDQSGEACIQGMGTQSVRLDFSWSSNVISHGGLVTGGDEAALRLGLASDLNNFEAGDYSEGEATRLSNGHFVTVQVCPEAYAVIDAKAICSPSSGQPCTLSAGGHVVGCPCDNYSVMVEFFNTASGASVGTAVVNVTNGSQTWSASVVQTGGGPCNPPYAAVASLVDNPGLLSEVHVFGETHNAQGSPMAYAVMSGPVACMDLNVPTMGEWGLIAMGVIFLGAGSMVIHRRMF